MIENSRHHIEDRYKVKRHPERACHDSETIYNILDAMPMCSVGYVIDGQPYVTPTLQWREGNHIYWHGSSVSRMLKAVDGAPVCVTVSILDGFVMARSAFHHSANFRSVMLFGTARAVTDFETKAMKFRNFVEGLFPGRWERLRPMTKKEVDATDLLTLPIEQAVAKVRTGPPKDKAEDVTHPVWAGVIPVYLQTGLLQDAPDLVSPNKAEPSVKNFTIGSQTNASCQNNTVKDSIPSWMKGWR